MASSILRRAPFLLLALLSAGSPLAATVRFVAFGDSVTAGVGDGSSLGGYPGRLEGLLQGLGLDAEVENRGVGGETTAEGLARIESVLDDGGDVLLLMEGTNDISSWISEETLIFNLREMAKRTEERGLSVVHASLIPRRPDALVDDENRITTSVNEEIARLAFTTVWPFVDAYDALASLPDVFDGYYWDEPTDRVGHPNAAGYGVLAGTFLSAASSSCYFGAGVAADFTATPLQGAPPLEVAFTDLSSPESRRWEWDFDDDGILDSLQRNTSFLYQEPGSYTVRLRVGDGRCTAVAARPGLVTVSAEPPPPQGLTATAVSTSRIELTWDEPSAQTTFLELEMRTETGDYLPLTSLPPDVTSLAMNGLPAATYHAFRLRAGNDEGLSAPAEAAVTTWGEPGACREDPAVLCLSGGRIEARVAWRDFQDREGIGTGSALSSDSGVYWFFRPENLELVVKVLDGSALNGHLWFFYGALSSVEYVLTLRETETGETRSYFNPSGSLASQADSEAFSLASSPALPAAVARAGEATQECSSDPTVLCLADGRFELRVEWRDFQGQTGLGVALPETPDTGFFWFFRPGNVELMVKILDGRAINGSFWVFFGAISNVEYTLTIRDTTTGDERSYSNPLGTFASVADTEAF